jgi:hypothetical protein
MASFSKQWIVLIGKSPKGPLNEEEIRDLLAQKVIRTNDIAYQLPESTELKAPTEWKLLWQYPEFDRRKESPSNSPQAERRKKEPSLAALTELPAELLNISPEDLLPRSSSAQAFEKASEDAPAIRRSLRDRLLGNRSFSPTLGFAGLSAICLGVTLWLWSSPTSVPVTAPREPERLPAETFVPRRSLDRATGQMALPRIKPDSAPVEMREVETREPDSGEIPPPMEGSEDEEPLSPPGRPLGMPVRVRAGERKPNGLLLPQSDEDLESQEEAFSTDTEEPIATDAAPAEE